MIKSRVIYKQKSLILIYMTHSSYTGIGKPTCSSSSNYQSGGLDKMMTSYETSAYLANSVNKDFTSGNVLPQNTYGSGAVSTPSNTAGGYIEQPCPVRNDPSLYKAPNMVAYTPINGHSPTLGQVPDLLNGPGSK